MKIRRILPFLAAGILSISAPASVMAANAQDELSSLEAQQQISEDHLAAAQQAISNLEVKKQELEGYLTDLSAQYEELTGGVEELALKAGQKEQELKQVKIQLTKARQKEKEQYNAMKLRIAYMYEKSGGSYLETLLSCKSIGEFLNQAEYIQQITDYDRNMLKQYEETKNEIAQKERTIEEEVEQINALRVESSAKQQEVRDMVASTNDNIMAYAQEIAANEEEAQMLVNQIAQSEQAMNALLVVAQQEPAQASEALADTEDAPQAPQGQESQETPAPEQTEPKPSYPEGYNPEEDTLESSSSGTSSDVSVSVETPSGEDTGYGDTQDTLEDGTQDVPSQEAADGTDNGQETFPSEGEETQPGTDTGTEGTGDSGQGTYLGTFTLTAYCGCAQCCGAAGQPTASGVMPTAGHTVAMAGVPFGTQLLINGVVYTVEDLGTPYGHVDIYFDSHDAALAFGLQSAEVYQLN